MKKNAINMLYFSAVIMVALSVSSLALARKINIHRQTGKMLTFTVEKDKVIVTNATEGVVKEIHVNSGEYVQRGDILAEIENKVLTAQLATLEEFGAVNLSAKTQAEMLKSQVESQTITAPREGYIHVVHVSEGSIVTTNSEIFSMYATDEVRLSTQLRVDEIEYYQRQPSLEVYNPRLERSYTIAYTAINQVNQPNDQLLYKTYFLPSEQDPIGELLHNEELILPAFDPEAVNNRPAELVANAWNTLIIGQ